MPRGRPRKPDGAPKAKYTSRKLVKRENYTPLPDEAPDNATPYDEDATRALFASHRQKWLGWRTKLAAVDAIEREVKAALKADGFTVKQFVIADQLTGTPKQEAKVRCEVKDLLLVARWVNHPMGAQLDLFEQPLTLQTGVGSPYEQGKQAAMDNQAPRPPEGIESQVWLAGFHDEQARQVRAGIKPVENGHDAPAEPAPDAAGQEPPTPHGQSFEQETQL
jgi:hypothetical protein